MTIKYIYIYTYIFYLEFKYYFSITRIVLMSSVHVSSLSLPKVVKRRVNALKNLQVKCAHIEAKFYEEVHELERKYAALYQPLFDKVCFWSCVYLLKKSWFVTTK